MNEEEYLEKIADIELQLTNCIVEKNKLNQKIKILTSEKESLTELYNLEKMKNKPDNSQFAQRTFEWSQKIERILKEKFKFETFKNKQLVAINATLSKKDVLLVMPTGGGKSLVYQLPALVDGHITIVVSPLISLIDDQLNALEKLGIEAVTLNSDSSNDHKKHVLKAMITENSSLRLIYVTPEWVAKSKMFMNNLQKCYDKGYLDRIVIDEVHCCSTWGHDFRPDYNYLSFFKTMFPDIPLLGLTATASLKVLVDLQRMLSLTDVVLITAPFNRPNLFYKVIVKPLLAPINYVIKCVSEDYKDQSGIIYAPTIKSCEELCRKLQDEDLRVQIYHSQLSSQTKKKVLERWMNNRYQVIIATIAFGMGIDKPDVRFVIHYGLPKSIEAYYQESGRAGRNGDRADCILMYDLSDYLRILMMASSVQQESYAAPVLEYCLEQNRCRRQLIANYFDTDWDPSNCNKMCDLCKTPRELKEYDVTQAYKDLIKILDTAQEKEIKLTLIKLLNIWFQIGNREFRIPSMKKPICFFDHGEFIIAYLIKNGFLRIEKGYTMYTNVAYIKKGHKEDTKNISIFYPEDLRYPCLSGSKRKRTL